MKKQPLIKKNMTIQQVLEMNQNFAAVLMEYGMHCFGCPFSRMETLAEASQVHGFDIDELIDKLNKMMQK